MPTDLNLFPSDNNFIKSFGPITSASLPEIIAQFNQENDSTPRTSILKMVNFFWIFFFRPNASTFANTKIYTLFFGERDSGLALKTYYPIYLGKIINEFLAMIFLSTIIFHM